MATTTRSAIRARLLGGFDVAVDGVPVPMAAFVRASGLRLLKVLLATPGHRLRREEIAELLWPEADPDRSAGELRKAVHYARRALATAGPAGEGIVTRDGPDLVLAGAASVDVDDLLAAVDQVVRLHLDGATSSSAAHLAPALDSLISLAGEDLLPSDPFEEWLAPIRERVRARTLDALVVGAALARQTGDRPRGFALVQRALTLEPGDERAHRLAIELHLDAGELHAARRQLQACRQAVAEAFGVEPDPALGVLIEAAVAERPEAVYGAIAEAPIIGRRREIELVEDRVGDIARGAASTIALLRGPAGIGKSRLLREIAGSVRTRGWPIIELRGLEAAADAPLAAAATAILGALGGSLPSTLGEPARSAMLIAAPELSEVPSIAFASDDALLRALLEALRALAPADAPVVALVDDAQWLDHASLNFLDAAIGASAPRTAALVATVRDEPALIAGPVSVLLAAVDRVHGDEIHVGPLGLSEIRAIVERDVAEGPMDDALAASIAEFAAGTPLYAVELFRSARESRLVEVRDGRWSFRRGVDALRVPDGIARVVDRRLSRLGPVARIVLATAAELGDVVAFEDLVATGSSTDDVLDAIDAALEAGIVAEVSLRYAFAHPLYRDALRRGLPPRDRASVHRRIAEMLARGIDPADADAVRRAGARGVDILAIARHAASAAALGSREAGALAVGFGFGAGARQADLFDFTGSIRTFERALELWQRLPELERDRFGVSAAHVRLGEALRRTGDDLGASAAFDEAMLTARGDGELATAGSAAAWLPYEHGRYEVALAILERVGARIGDPAAQALLDSTRAWILGREGDWDGAIGILTQTIATFDAGGPSPDLMRALDRLAIAYRDATPSNAFAAIPLLERAINMAVELGRTGERATYEMHLAGVYQALHRYDEAIATLDRARGLCQLTGEQYIETVVEWVSAEVEQLRGDHRAAIGHRRRELEIFAAIGGNARHEALAHAHLAHLARLVGDAQLAVAESEAARVGARHSGIDGLEARVEEALAIDDWFARQG